MTANDSVAKATRINAGAPARADQRWLEDGLVPHLGTGETTTSTYRQGDTGRPMGQGESLATSADPLAQRQTIGREASDGESR